MKDAMKTGDEVRKRTVRMVLAAVKQVEVDKQAPVEDLAVVALIQKEIKNRREAIEEANKANRPDLRRCLTMLALEPNGSIALTTERLLQASFEVSRMTTRSRSTALELY